MLYNLLHQWNVSILHSFTTKYLLLAVVYSFKSGRRLEKIFLNILKFFTEFHISKHFVNVPVYVNFIFGWIDLMKYLYSITVHVCILFLMSNTKFSAVYWVLFLFSHNLEIIIDKTFTMTLTDSVSPVNSKIIDHI